MIEAMESAEDPAAKEYSGDDAAGLGTYSSSETGHAGPDAGCSETSSRTGLDIHVESLVPAPPKASDRSY